MQKYISFLPEKFKTKIEEITPLKVQASTREFFRIKLKKSTVVAMCFNGDSVDTIKKIEHFQRIYKKYDIDVPKNYDLFANRILLQEDLGDISLASIFPTLNNLKKEKILSQISNVLRKIKTIPVNYSNEFLDEKRVKKELDFFFLHFANHFFKNRKELLQDIEQSLKNITNNLKNKEKIFAHRDFHSENIMIKNGEIYLIDFQDSLIAPPYYDSVSIIFDSYLSLDKYRGKIINEISYNENDFWTIALQRNIKALGTFAFQSRVKGKNFSQFIAPCIKHIINNPLSKMFFSSPVLKELKKLITPLAKN